MITRRRFINRSLASLGFGTIVSSPLFAQQRSGYLTFDLHSHPGLQFNQGNTAYVGTESARTANEMNEGGLNGAFFSLVADAPLIAPGPSGVISKGDYAQGDGWKEYKRQLKAVKSLISAWPMIPATKTADLRKAQTDRKVAAFLAIEGGDFLEGDAAKLEEMYSDGVRSIQIVHYHPNELGDLQTSDSKFGGLSVAGKDVVKGMNKLRMLIDVAHASQETVQHVVDLTDAPIILSHSVLRIDMDRPLAKRTITPEHAKLIARTGGVIGAWPSGYSKDFNEFMDGIKRLADIVGPDHIGLGTDLDGNFKPVIDSYLKLPVFIESLGKTGFNSEEVRKIAGENMERVLSKVIG